MPGWLCNQNHRNFCSWILSNEFDKVLQTFCSSPPLVIIAPSIGSETRKFHGINNLRVIDASIIPIIPDCRPQNTVYMVGEKGADLIKADHKDLYEQRSCPGCRKTL